MKKSTKRALVTFTFILCILLLAFLIMLTVSDGDPFPNWDTLLNGKGEKTSVLDEDYFRMVDVGQGDCLLFYSNGVSALIDTGTPENAVATRQKLVDYGIGKLNMVSVTHFHDDHTGGLPAIAELFSIENFIHPEIKGSSKSIDDVLTVNNKLANGVGNVYPAKQGMVIRVGDFEITVLAHYADERDINDQSIYMMAEIDGKKILLTGDGERKSEKRLMAEGIDIDCDILKVGHHGSNTSTSSAFLEACTPDYAGISCGLNNKYSHPNKEVLERLQKRKTEIHRTDLEGDITFRVDDGKVIVETEK